MIDEELCEIEERAERVMWSITPGFSVDKLSALACDVHRLVGALRAERLKSEAAEIQYLKDFHHGASSVIGLVHWNLKQAADLNELGDKGHRAFELISSFVRTCPRSPGEILLKAAQAKEATS